MKKFFRSGITANMLLLALSCTLFAFGAKRGGDIFEIRLDQKLVLRQFVHLNEGTKTLRLNQGNEQGIVSVTYNECGKTGSGRKIFLRNEKNEVIRELKFPDSEPVMSFKVKDLAGKGLTGKNLLYYSSAYAPNGQVLAAIDLSTSASL